MKTPIAIIAVAVVGGVLLAQDRKPQEITFVKAGDVKWTESPALTKDMKVCLQHGDPVKGPVLVLMKLTAGSWVPPHWHSSDECTTVLSGTILLAQGEKVDESKAVEMGPGSYFIIPAKTPHWGKAKTDAVLVRYGAGVNDFNYCDEKDDPRKK
jgi:quercetin dioxygenase-like cupin family protein